MTSKEVAKRFGKQRLLDIASEELELDIDPSTHIYDVIEAIENDLDENGVPEEMGDSLFDLCVALEFIDEDGNLLEEEEPDEDDDEGGEQEDEEEAEEVDLEKLPCWGRGDAEDPACAKCPHLTLCLVKRRENRPRCFGALFDAEHPDCDACLYYDECQEAMPQ